MKQIIAMILTFFSLFSFGCGNNVDPYIPLEDSLVLYCMLDTRIDENLVRISRTYYQNTSRQVDKNLFMVLEESNGMSHTLRDTIIKGYENYKYFIIPKDYLKRGQMYRLILKRDSTSKYISDCLYPPESGLKIIESADPPDFISSFTVSFYRGASDYFLQTLNLCYSIEGSSQIFYQQFPLHIWISTESRFYEPNKPIYEYDKYMLNYEESLIQENHNITLRNMSVKSERYESFYNTDITRLMLNTLKKEHGNKVRIKGMYAFYYAFDKNYYEHYMLKMNDQFSVRSDEPLYWTNVKCTNGKGYGFFGAMAVDTAYCRLSAYMINKFGFIDDQK